MTLSWRFTALSDVGRVRRDNQDSGYAGPHLLVVADGVGGAARGDVASGAAVAQLRLLDRPPGNDALEQLAGSIHLAHNKIADLVSDDPELDGTSTTLTAALFDGSRVSLAHVGDSRAYLLRGGALDQLTTDHTLVQSLVDEGRITDEDARTHPHRNIILRAVDGVHEPEPDVSTLDVHVGDRLLLCSDGCSGVLESDQLAGLLTTDPLEDAATALVTAALEAGSSDNVTVVLAELVDSEEAGAAEAGDAAEPIVVGAAASSRGPVRSPLRRRRTEPDAAPDPEALRYAPLPPRRLWPRRLAVVLVVLALLLGAAYAAYRYTQSQYYLGARDGKVVIYRGVSASWSVPGFPMHRVVQDTPLLLDDLTESDRTSVAEGLPEGTLAQAREKVAALEQRVCDAAAAEQQRAADRALRRARATAKAHHRTPPTKIDTPTLPTTYPGCTGRS
ncbi:MAG: PP2C family protein-serine/threonine phosphatase [Marmoricola sp.]